MLPTHSEVDLSSAGLTLPDFSKFNGCLTAYQLRKSLPAIFYFNSNGGINGQIAPTITRLKKLLSESRSQSGEPPSVIISDFCNSACLPVLAALNQMAGEGTIDLIVQPQTQLGFHGASNPVDGYSTDGTDRYLRYLTENGVSEEWIKENAAVFSTTEFTTFYPRDERLKDAQLITHAIVIDKRLWRLSRFRVWFNKM